MSDQPDPVAEKRAADLAAHNALPDELRQAIETAVSIASVDGVNIDAAAAYLQPFSPADFPTPLDARAAIRHAAAILAPAAGIPDA